VKTIRYQKPEVKWKFSKKLITKLIINYLVIISVYLSIQESEQHKVFPEFVTKHDCIHVLRVWTGFNLLRIRFSGGFCEHGNEPSSSIKSGEFLE